MSPATRRGHANRTLEKRNPPPREYRNKGHGRTGAAGVWCPGMLGRCQCHDGMIGPIPIHMWLVCAGRDDGKCDDTISIHKPHQLVFCFSRRPARAGRNKGKCAVHYRGDGDEDDVLAFRIKKFPHRGFRCGGWCNRIWFSSRGRPHKSNPCCTGFAPSGHGSWGCRVRKSPDCPRHRTCRGCRHGR